MTRPQTGEADAFDSVAAELIAAFDAWTPEADSWSAETLDAWARRAFRVQYDGNRAYRQYCDARGVSRGSVRGWRDAVPVPTAAFRAVDLIVGSAGDARVTFRTSGTTRGASARGRHLVRSPELYRASLRAGFRAFVMAGESSARIVTLPPTFTYDATSSLGWMLDDLRAWAGAGNSVSAATSTGIDWGLIEHETHAAATASRPLCVLGTTLGFAEWLDRLESGGCRAVLLPADSVLMDTGGEKGRPGLSRAAVVRGLASRLGLPVESVVNEFGMTELLSQRYGRGDPGVPLLGPPWLRSRVLDPVTLEELPEGDEGILCHYDLANLGSVCSVLTEDRGRIVGEGIEWIGRTEGAPPRGCSLATAELLEAQGNA
jgi:hypothetical protein